MKKDELIGVFDKLCACEAWSFQIVQIKDSKKSGVAYICREVEFDPNENLLEFLNKIKKFYCSERGIAKYLSIDDYTGDVVNNTIYEIDVTSDLISVEYNALIQATSVPDKEMELSKIKPNASLFKGTVELDQVKAPVMLISLHKPITAFTNKLLWMDTDKFRIINSPVLTISETIDVAIVGDKVYLFNLLGEKLFNMERTYKTVCKQKVEKIINSNLFSDVESFRTIANSGMNPRRFISYNEEHFKWILNKNNRKKVADQFGIKLVGNLIDTSDEKAVDRLLRFLCNKAMLDPCNEQPVEVVASKPWS